MNLFSQVLTTTPEGHLDPLAYGCIYAVGRAAATTVSGFDVLDGNELLETISYGRRAGLRVVSTALPLRNNLNFHEQYVPMKLCYKEKFEPLVAFSHEHHSVSTPTSTILRAKKVASGERIDTSGGYSSEGMSPDSGKSGGGVVSDADDMQTFSVPALNVLCFALPSSASELKIGPGEGLSLRIVVNNTEVSSPS